MHFASLSPSSFPRHWCGPQIPRSDLCELCRACAALTWSCESSDSPECAVFSVSSSFFTEFLPDMYLRSILNVNVTSCSWISSSYFQFFLFRSLGSIYLFFVWHSNDVSQACGLRIWSLGLLSLVSKSLLASSKERDHLWNVQVGCLLSEKWDMLFQIVP